MTQNERSIVRRHSERASYDKEKLMEILDRNFIAHVSFQIDGQPYAIPMMYVNDREFVYFHGSGESRIINVLKKGIPVAISVLEIKGVVIRTEMINNSIHYASAIIFGKGTPLTDTEKKVQTFRLLMERLLPGRWNDTKVPDENDIKKVEVVSVKIEDFSLKINLNDPKSSDDPKIWEGIIPIVTSYGPARSISKVEIPDYVEKINGKVLYL